MIQRPSTLDPMAKILADHPDATRADETAAALVLLRAGFSARAIAAGLDAARARAGEALTWATSDAPAALAVGRCRDLAAATVLLVAGAQAWGWL